MKDEVFAVILKGIIAQSKVVPVMLKSKPGMPPPPQERLMVNLSKICYTNNQLGEKSLAQIMKIIPYITDLEINNAQTGMNQVIHKQLSSSIFQNGGSMRKLRLSNVNLNDDTIIDNIIATIQTNKQHL